MPEEDCPSGPSCAPATAPRTGVNSVRELRDGAGWPPQLWISTGKGIFYSKGIEPHREVSFLQVKEKRHRDFSAMTVQLNRGQ